MSEKKNEIRKERKKTLKNKHKTHIEKLKKWQNAKNIIRSLSIPVLLIILILSAILIYRDCQKAATILLLITSLLIIIYFGFYIWNEIRKNPIIPALALLLMVIYGLSDRIDSNLSIINTTIMSFGLELIFFKMSFVPKNERIKHEMKNKLSITENKDKYIFDDFFYARRNDSIQNIIKSIVYCMVVFPVIGRNISYSIIKKDLIPKIEIDSFLRMLICMVICITIYFIYINKSKETAYTNKIYHDRLARELSESELNDLKEFEHEERVYIIIKDDENKAENDDTALK